MRTIFYILFLSNLLFAQTTTTEKIGDALRLAIPIGAYASTLYLEDKEGQMEFYKSFGVTVASTYALKYTVKRERPNGENDRSFPSGHSSSTFGAASFIHLRYGWEYAVLPYVGAIYTGYSRVASKQHYIGDVIAGATIGILSSWYFTLPYNKLQVEAFNKQGYRGIQFLYNW